MQKTKLSAIFRESILSLSLLLVSVFLVATHLAADNQGGSSTGNSGDLWRSYFQNGKDLLLQNTIKAQTCLAASANLTPSEAWIKDNILEFYQEANGGQFVIASTPTPSCAWTERKRFAPVLINGEKCDFANNRPAELTARLIAHEIVHHFDIADEGFADQVAKDINDNDRLLGCLPRSMDDRFGALTYSLTEKRLFMTKDKNKRDDAVQESTTQCLKRSPSEKCQLLDWIRYTKDTTPPTCVAVFQASSQPNDGLKFFTERDATLEAAKSLANAKCHLSSGSNCEFLGAYCTDGNLIDAQNPKADGEIIDADHLYSCSVQDGRITCRGFDTDEIFKDASKLRNVTEFTTRYGAACAIDDQSVKCWGRSFTGTPGQVPYDKLKSPSHVALGFGFACAIDQGRVICWGSHLLQDLNIKVETPRAIVAGMQEFCLIDGKNIRCFGDFGEETPPPPYQFVNPQKISMKDHQVCVIDDETLRCWDIRLQGGSSPIAIPVFINNPKDVSVGSGGKVCVIDDDGPKCWGGKNEHGENEIPDNLKNPRKISAGQGQTCVIDDDGVNCWGKAN